MASAVALAVLLPVFWPSLQPMITVPALRWGELLTAGLLVAGSAVTIEMGRLFEGRVRVGQRPHKGLSAWAMASVILLPGFWVLPVVVGVYGYARWRGMRVPLWKWVGSGAFLVIAGLIANKVLRIGPPDQPLGLSSTPAGTLLVAAAVLVFLAVESALLSGSAHLCSESDEVWLRRTLADPGFYVTEAAVLSLGAVTGLLGAAAPWSMLLLLPAYGLMQQAVLHRPLRDQAALDCKTGLLRYEPWLRAATERLAHHGSTRGPWSVLFADLDRFKDFNDRHGHLAGDRALGRVAQVLRDTVRERDLLARFGGEEFCVLLPGADLDRALIVAERIRLAIKTLTPDDIGGRLTISIGVASVGADQPDVSLVDALTTADGALYHAKLAGRDTVRLADHRMTRPVGGGHDPFRHDGEPYSGVDGFSSAVVPFVRDARPAVNGDIAGDRAAGAGSCSTRPAHSPPSPTPASNSNTGTRNGPPGPAHPDGSAPTWRHANHAATGPGPHRPRPRRPPPTAQPNPPILNREPARFDLPVVRPSSLVTTRASPAPRADLVGAGGGQAVIEVAAT